MGRVAEDQARGRVAEDRSIRILLTIDNLGWGGAQRQIANLAVGLKSRGHDVHLYLYQPRFDHVAEPVRAAGVEIIEFDKRTRFDPNVLFALVRHVKRAGFDAGVAFLPTPGTYAVLASLLSSRFPVVTSERFYFPEEGLPLREKLRRAPYRLAAHVTANSHHQLESMVRELPWLEGRVSTIWNGVDTDLFRPRSGAGLRDATKPLRVLGAGTIVPRKSIALLANALTILARRGGPEVEVAWAGQQTESAASREIVARIDAQLAEHRLSDRWEWLGLRSDLPALHHEYDALVHPSAAEGLPNVVCEALAGGLPVIACRWGDHDRLLEAPERGFLFDVGDAESLADSLAALATIRPPELSAMRTRCRAFAEHELSLDRYAARYENLLTRLVAAKSS